MNRAQEGRKSLFFSLASQHRLDLAGACSQLIRLIDRDCLARLVLHFVDKCIELVAGGVDAVCRAGTEYSLGLLQRGNQAGLDSSVEVEAFDQGNEIIGEIRRYP